MDLVKRAGLFVMFVAVSSTVWAQGLSLTLGSAVAGQDFRMKSLQFVFRLNGCADLSKAQVTAKAEGLVDGARRSNEVKAVPLPNQPGAYAMPDQNAADGVWVVAITANCQNETTGAIVRLNGRSFSRDGSQLLSHAPTPAEIDAALKSAR